MNRIETRNVRVVEDEVADWLVRRDSADWTEADQAELDRWLEASTANVVAFVRMEDTWQRSQRLKSLGAGVPRGVVPNPDDWQLSLVFKQPEPRVPGPFKRLRWVALAASLGMATVVSAWWLHSQPPSYRTPVGGMASVPMADGSKITLNTDSEIRILVTKSQRSVQLERGEAFFEVAPDAARPFMVTAGRQRVVAIGTAFSVRRDRDDIQVAVTNGKVSVAEISGASDAPVMLSAGSMARSRRHRVTLEKKPVPEVEEALSWRTGFLTFHDTPLVDAVAEFNRYNLQHIVVDAPALAGVQLSGRFQVTQSEAFIRLLEERFALQVESRGDRIVLRAR